MPDNKGLERLREIEFLRENFRNRARAWGFSEERIEQAIQEAENERANIGASLQ